MPSLEKLYEWAISIRNLEVEQFWKRNVFLFGIEGLILSFFIGGFESLMNSGYNFILVVSAAFGLIFSAITYKIVDIDRKWVDYWENKLQKIEQENNFQIKLFDNHGNGKINEVIKGYRSTKRLTLGICLLFVGFWIVILGYVILSAMPQGIV